MSYYGGGYTSYASYSSYGASMNYTYNSDYNANSCYDSGNYLNNLNNYIREVGYGSYASQCANWQNTATTIVLWHLLFPAENNNDWKTVNDNIVHITLKVDEAEEALECFMEGVLAFLEQIGGNISNDSQKIAITLPDNIKTVGVDFYHGMLAFLIEIYGFDNIESRISLHSAYSEPESAFKIFLESYEQINAENQQKVAVIKKAVSHTNDLHDKNEEVIRENRQRAKRTVAASAIIGCLAALSTAFVVSSSENALIAIIGIATTVGSVAALITGLVNMKETHKLQKKTLNSIADMSSVIEQLDALELRNNQ